MIAQHQTTHTIWYTNSAYVLISANADFLIYPVKYRCNIEDAEVT